MNPSNNKQQALVDTLSYWMLQLDIFILEKSSEYKILKT